MTSDPPAAVLSAPLPARALFTGGDLSDVDDALRDALRGEFEGANPPRFRLHVGTGGAVTLVACTPHDAHTSEAPAPPSPCVRLPEEIEAAPFPVEERLELSPGVTRRWVHPAHVELHLPGPTSEMPLLRLTIIPRLPMGDDVLRQLLSSSPPRTPGVLQALILPIPVESAGPLGQGGRDGDAVYHRLPDPLRDHLEAGTFDLVLATGDAGVQWNDDISDAVARSSKVWLHRPLAQLVVDGMRQPRARRRGSPWTRGTSIRPQLFSQHLGFARLEFFDGLMTPTVLVQRGREWLEADVPYPIGHAAPRSPRRAVPAMTPCRDCDPTMGTTAPPR